LGTASSFGKGLFPKPLEKYLIGFWVRLLPSGRAFSQNHRKINNQNSSNAFSGYQAAKGHYSKIFLQQKLSVNNV